MRVGRSHFLPYIRESFSVLELRAPVVHGFGRPDTRVYRTLCTDFGEPRTHDLSPTETRQTFGAVEFKKK
jgi:hypothetical protein